VESGSSNSGATSPATGIFPLAMLKLPPKPAINGSRFHISLQSAASIAAHSL
jgi:hypothetical protein